MRERNCATLELRVMNENQILAISLAVPNLLAVLMGILINNSRANDTNVRLGELRAHLDQRFNTVDQRFERMQAEMNRRFDDSKDVWKSELHRVEEIIDARLKHLESR